MRCWIGFVLCLFQACACSCWSLTSSLLFTLLALPLDSEVATVVHARIRPLNGSCPRAGRVEERAAQHTLNEPLEAGLTAV